MKRQNYFLSTLLVLTLGLGFIGCGKKNASNNTDYSSGFTNSTGIPMSAGWVGFNTQYQKEVCGYVSSSPNLTSFSKIKLAATTLTKDGKPAQVTALMGYSYFQNTINSMLGGMGGVGGMGGIGAPMLGMGPKSLSEGLYMLYSSSNLFRQHWTEAMQGDRLVCVRGSIMNPHQYVIPPYLPLSFLGLAGFTNSMLTQFINNISTQLSTGPGEVAFLAQSVSFIEGDTN